MCQCVARYNFIFATMTIKTELITVSRKINIFILSDWIHTFQCVTPTNLTSTTQLIGTRALFILADRPTLINEMGESHTANIKA